MNNFTNFLNHLNSFTKKQPIREQSSNYSYSDSSMKRLGKDLSNPTAIGAGALAGGGVGFALGGPPGALVGSAVGALNGVGYNALPTMMNNFIPDDPELDTDFNRVQKRTEQEEQKRREDVSKANPDLAARMQEDPRNRPGIGMGIARAMNDMSRMQTKVNAASRNLNNLQNPLKENTLRSIFLNHLNSFSKKPIIQEQKEKSSLKKKYKLNEISGRFWSPGPEGRGPDRVSKGSPPAMQLLSDKPATEREPMDIQQVHRTNLLAHQHQMFSEYHPTFFASMPPNSESTYTANQKRAIRVAQSKNANEETLLLAASHNDPIVRAAAHDNRNATDNVKGMALLHRSLQQSMMASLQHSRISPTALFAPENRKIVSAIGTKLKSFRTAISNHMSRGGNLLELHERQQRGEDTDANGNQID